jgi:hypothetical protein
MVRLTSRPHTERMLLLDGRPEISRSRDHRPVSSGPYSAGCAGSGRAPSPPPSRPSRKRRLWLWWGAGALGLVFAGVALSQFWMARPTPVSVEIVTPAPVTRVLAVNGRLAARSFGCSCARALAVPSWRSPWPKAMWSRPVRFWRGSTQKLRTRSSGRRWPDPRRSERDTGRGRCRRGLCDPDRRRPARRAATGR